MSLRVSKGFTTKKSEEGERKERVIVQRDVAKINKFNHCFIIDKNDKLMLRHFDDELILLS